MKPVAGYEELLAEMDEEYERAYENIAKLKPLIEFAEAIGEALKPLIEFAEASGEQWEDSSPRRSAHVSYNDYGLALYLRIEAEDRVEEAVSFVAKGCREHGIGEPERQAEREWDIYFPMERRWLNLVVTDA